MELEQALAIAAAAPPGVFEIGDRQFVLRPLKHAEKLALGAEMRRQIMAASKDPIDLLNEKIAAAEKAERPYSPTTIEALTKAALASAGRKEGKTEPTAEMIQAQMYTLDGARFFVWYWLHTADPTVTRKQVAEWLPNEDAVNDAYARLTELSGLKDVDPKKA